MIWITHNLQQALTIGHYTWVMMNGELIETGKSALLKAPTNPRVAEFVQGLTYDLYVLITNINFRVHPSTAIQNIKIRT